MPLALNVIVVVRLVYHTAAAVTVEALWLRKQLLLPCSILEWDIYYLEKQISHRVA